MNKFYAFKCIKAKYTIDAFITKRLKKNNVRRTLEIKATIKSLLKKKKSKVAYAYNSLHFVFILLPCVKVLKCLCIDTSAASSIIQTIEAHILRIVKAVARLCYVKTMFALS